MIATDETRGVPDPLGVGKRKADGMLSYTTFRVTDTQDGRYAVEDERGFVLEGLTRTQAKRLKAYLLKLRAEAARPAAATPINAGEDQSRRVGPQVPPQAVSAWKRPK
jgi:hypothetical protein